MFDSIKDGCHSVGADLHRALNLKIQLKCRIFEEELNCNGKLLMRNLTAILNRNLKIVQQVCKIYNKKMERTKSFYKVNFSRFILLIPEQSAFSFVSVS